MMPSDEALELLDGMVELQTIDATSAATSSDIMHSLDIPDLASFAKWLRELVDSDYVRKRSPKSIQETVAYYVNIPMFRRLLEKLDLAGETISVAREAKLDNAVTDFKLFEQRVMLALYRAWQDGNSPTTFAKALDAAGIQWEQGWLVRVHDSLRSKGFVEGPANRRIEEMTFGSLTAEGLQYVEDNLSPYDTSDEKVEPTGGIDSSTWTGLPKTFVLTDEKRISIVRALDTVEHALPNSEATQHDQAQARAYVLAAKALLEAPHPEPELAWQLIGRANSLAGIASLFITIIALFLR